MIATKTDVRGDVQAIAAEAFAVLNTGRQIAPFSDRVPGFDLDDAYRVTAAVRKCARPAARRRSGARSASPTAPSGTEYSVSAPMWGYVYDRTVHDLAARRRLLAGGAGRATDRAGDRLRPRRRAEPGHGRGRPSGLRRMGRARLRDGAVDLSRLEVLPARHRRRLRPARRADDRPPARRRSASRAVASRPWRRSRSHYCATERSSTAGGPRTSSTARSPPSAPRRPARPRSGEPAARRRRDRHHRHADARLPVAPGETWTHRPHWRRPRRHPRPLCVSASWRCRFQKSVSCTDALNAAAAHHDP